MSVENGAGAGTYVVNDAEIVSLLERTADESGVSPDELVEEAVANLLADDRGQGAVARVSLAGLHRAQDAIASDVRGLRDSLVAPVRDLADGMRRIESRLDNLERGQARVGASLSGLSSSQASLGDSVAALGIRLDSVERHVADLADVRLFVEDPRDGRFDRYEPSGAADAVTYGNEGVTDGAARQ